MFCSLNLVFRSVLKEDEDRRIEFNDGNLSISSSGFFMVGALIDPLELLSALCLRS